jgi:AcrR family transcriptional regulator
MTAVPAPPPPGLRERKKEQTRQAIAAAAFGMFAERGFDAVTVVAVARQAGVSEATVFNYFPTKEDLVYGRLEEFEAGLVRAVRERAPGQPITAAAGAFLLESRGLLGDDSPGARARLAAVNRIIADSPSLLARERQIYDQYTHTLAALIAEQGSAGPGPAGPGDVEAWVVANAIIGVHRGLVAYVRRSVLEGKGGPGLAREVRDQAERALAVLDLGLAGYALQERPRAAQ